MRTIKTRYDDHLEPFGWCAWDDDQHPHGPIGTGRTEVAALHSLIDKLDAVDQAAHDEDSAFIDQVMKDWGRPL